MKAKLPFACVLALALAGCTATIALDKTIDGSPQKVALKDSRTAEERISRRNGVHDPIQYFGDEDFDSPPLQQLSSLLGARLPPGKYDLDVTRFRVIDIYPKRLKVTTDAARAGALMTLGITTYIREPRLDQDNITCLVSGSVGTKTVTASDSVPYEVSRLSALVKHDPSFKKAVNDCLVRLADKLASSM